MLPREYLSWRVPYIPDEENLDIIAYQWCKKYPPEAVLGAMKRALKGKPGQIEFTQDECQKFKNEVSELLKSLPSYNWYDNFNI